MKVLLNVAHSADTKGKRSPDGRLIEYEYSKDICQRVHAALTLAGVRAEIIEQDDSNALKEVVMMANVHCAAEPCIFVSIHCNAAGAGDRWYKATGWSAYTTKGLTNADALATCLYDAAEQVLKPQGKKLRTDYSDGDPDLEADFYVLRNTRCPAVLTENFFMDCKADVDYLLSDEGKKEIAWIHIKGIMNYIKSRG